MRNPWLYVFHSKAYPSDTYCVTLSSKKIETVQEEMWQTHYKKPKPILGYAIADYDGVRNRLSDIVSRENPHFVHMIFVELQKKIESVIIGKAPTIEQLDILKFVGGHCGRVDCCRSADLYKLYKKNGGMESVTTFTHLLQSVGIQKKRTKYGVIILNVSPKAPDSIQLWWENRIKTNDHQVYQSPVHVWDSYQSYVHGNKIQGSTVPECWFWKRLEHLVEYQRLKLPDQKTAITFPSLKVCESLTAMAAT